MIKLEATNIGFGWENGEQVCYVLSINNYVLKIIKNIRLNKRDK